ncbi:hypothetical protein, partial [Vibrio hyugaensis]|uniref:hypothetical protein n=1 Tax=Vibrio hyugaensis TaxID=1534743 RepID=UPI0018CD494D
MNAYDSFFRNIADENWEFFATDVLNSLGFTIIEYPSRGPDGGKDSIVEREGIRYIVSCKHFYCSGRAVGVSDEESITDRINQHDAQGFIGFYSTVISSSLSSRMSALEQKEYKFKVYDRDFISDLLPVIPSWVLQKLKWSSKIGHRFVFIIKSA